MKTAETWVDAKGQVVYVKGSRKNRTEGLTREELKLVAVDYPLLSGTVTRPDGKVFFAPFKKVTI
jgi:hypothetical protein